MVIFPLFYLQLSHRSLPHMSYESSVAALASWVVAIKFPPSVT